MPRVRRKVKPPTDEPQTEFAFMRPERLPAPPYRRRLLPRKPPTTKDRPESDPAEFSPLPPPEVKVTDDGIIIKGLAPDPHTNEPSGDAWARGPGRTRR